MGRPKIVTFIINLHGDSDHPVYTAGSVIEGDVLLELLEPKKVQGIKIALSGRVHVGWTEQSGIFIPGGAVGGVIHYSDNEHVFASEKLQLWGDGKHSEEIPAGRHEFPFKFQLPSMTLPTSFESIYGHIRYTLTATISRPWKFDHNTKRAITINEIVDVNTSKLARPLQNSNEKTVCCLFCASNPITLSVKTDRAGYCPGELIAINVEASDQSRRRVTAIEAALKQVVMYHVRHPSRHKIEEKVIQTFTCPGISAGGKSLRHNELMTIPTTAPSISSCEILKLSYVLTVTLVMHHAMNLHVTIPLTIGNVPFKGHTANSAAAPHSTYSASKPDYFSPPANIPSNSVNSTYIVNGAHYPASGNPSYPPMPNGMINYSTVHAPVNIGDNEYTMGQTQYAPVYGYVTNYQFMPPEAIAKVNGTII